MVIKTKGILISLLETYLISKGNFDKIIKKNYSGSDGALSRGRVEIFIRKYNPDLTMMLW